MRHKNTDLINVICDGSMKAAVEIAARHDFLNIVNPKAICDALKIEIKNGYKLAAREAKDALIVNEKWAQATLNASCVSFAQNALIRCGYLGEGES